MHVGIGLADLNAGTSMSPDFPQRCEERLHLREGAELKAAQPHASSFEPASVLAITFRDCPGGCPNGSFRLATTSCSASNFSALRDASNERGVRMQRDRTPARSSREFNALSPHGDHPLGKFILTHDPSGTV